MLSPVKTVKTFAAVLLLIQCQKASAAVSSSHMIASSLKGFQRYPESQQPRFDEQTKYSRQPLQEKFPESTITRIQLLAPKSEAAFLSDPKTIQKLRSKTRTNSRFLRTFPPLELYKFVKRAGSLANNDIEDDDHRKILLGNPNKIRARLENGNSPVFYIRLPPAPYVFVPGIGYVSPHPYSNGPQLGANIPGMSMGIPSAPVMMTAGGPIGGSSGGFLLPSMDQDMSTEQPSQNVISLPLKFLSNGRPHQIEYPKKKKPPKQENSSENKDAAVISGGKYSFNGRPTAVFVVRSPAEGSSGPDMPEYILPQKNFSEK